MEKHTVGKYSGNYPTPASYEGDFWGNVAQAYIRSLFTNVDREEIEKNFADWKQFVIGKCSLGEAFFDGCLPDKNKSVATQLRAGFSSMIEAIYQDLQGVDCAQITVPNSVLFDELFVLKFSGYKVSKKQYTDSNNPAINCFYIISKKRQYE